VVLDGGVGSQHSQAENAVEGEQPVDFWFLVMSIVEKWHFQPSVSAICCNRAALDAVATPLIFLHLLKCKPELIG
jgi:hypothetical protein